MHYQRILTALAVGPLAFFVIWWGDEKIFSLFLASISLLCLFEYYSMVFQDRKFAIISGVVAGSIPVGVASYCGDPSLMILALFGGLLFSAIFFLMTYGAWDDVFNAWTKFYTGITYIGLCAAHAALIRALPLGREWIVFLLFIVFSGDAGAYYIGKGFGKHKLHPRVSKGKTIEGAMGGLLLNVIMALILWFLLLRTYTPWYLVFLAVSMGMVGQIGDLTASMIKRSVGVKDSGRLLPGHGGILDRIDAVLFAAPVLYWIVTFVSSDKLHLP